MSRTHRKRANRRRRRAATGATPRSKRLRPAFWPRIAGLVMGHTHSIFNGLGRMYRQPFGSLLTVTIIGIAMALPVGLHLTLKNMRAVAGGWHDETQISLFLNPGLKVDDVPHIQQRIFSQLGELDVDVKSPEEGLAEFRHAQGISDAVRILGRNPLPVVLIIYPEPEMSADALEEMTQTLQGFPEVDQALLDLRWVQRLHAIAELGDRATYLLGTLFAIAVLLTIGNSTRIEVQNRREEIAVEKLVGATAAFIRRPFLYTGFWLGLSGALVSLFLVWLVMMILSGPADELLRFYESDMVLEGIDRGLMVLVLAIGIGLGVLGALIALSRQLKVIEPDW